MEATRCSQTLISYHITTRCNDLEMEATRCSQTLISYHITTRCNDLEMEATRCSQTLISYQIHTRWHNPQYHSLKQHCITDVHLTGAHLLFARLQSSNWGRLLNNQRRVLTLSNGHSVDLSVRFVRLFCVILSFLTLRYETEIRKLSNITLTTVSEDAYVRLFRSKLPKHRVKRLWSNRLGDVHRNGMVILKRIFVILYIF
jgi:hypothetical protein